MYCCGCWVSCSLSPLRGFTQDTHRTHTHFLGCTWWYGTMWAVSSVFTTLPTMDFWKWSFPWRRLSYRPGNGSRRIIEIIKKGRLFWEEAIKLFETKESLSAQQTCLIQIPLDTNLSEMQLDIFTFYMVSPLKNSISSHSTLGCWMSRGRSAPRWITRLFMASPCRDTCSPQMSSITGQNLASSCCCTWYGQTIIRL